MFIVILARVFVCGRSASFEHPTKLGKQRIEKHVWMISSFQPGLKRLNCADLDCADLDCADLDCADLDCAAQFVFLTIRICRRRFLLE